MLKPIFFIVLFYSFDLFSREIHLKIGEQISFSKYGSLVIEKNETVKFQESRNTFTVSAQRSGQTTARSGSEIYNFYVLNRNQEITFSKLSQVLKNHKRLKVELSAGLVLVTGTLLRFSDWETLGNACLLSSCDYQMRVDPKPELHSKFETELRENLRKQGVQLPALLWEPTISTVLQNKKDANQLQALQSFGIKIISSSSVIDVQPLIKVELHVVEIKKEASISLGIDWPNQLSANLLPNASLNQSLDVVLKAFERNGECRTLASPTLLTRSGTQAEFLAGGELPIKTVSRFSNNVVWKKYGVSLKIKPRADSLGQLRLSLETEISRIDPAVSVDGVPGFFTHRTQSEFDLTQSKLIVLSGLFSKEDSESSQGVAGLSRIPILGSLFSSKDFRESKSELIIFVKPQIVGVQNVE